MLSQTEMRTSNGNVIEVFIKEEDDVNDSVVKLELKDSNVVTEFVNPYSDDLVEVNEPGVKIQNFENSETCIHEAFG